MLNVLRFVPPMTTSMEEVDRALTILDDAFRSVSAKGAARAAE
jgi:4-aminobutyrate aminotransferase-like enzyme